MASLNINKTPTQIYTRIIASIPKYKCSYNCLYSCLIIVSYIICYDYLSARIIIRITNKSINIIVSIYNFISNK